MAFAREVHVEIARWRQEAWDEQTDRYFFPMPEAEPLISGDKCFVVSRKGTGKSALAKHLLVSNRNGRWASRLSLNDFPYENFRTGLANSEEQSSQRFELGWQYVIYCEIASLMLQNPAVSWDTREQLRQVFAKKGIGAISNIRRWTSPDFWADLIEAGLQIRRPRERAAPTVREMRDAMRELVLENLGTSLYLIIFDGLDAGYAKLTPDRHSEYVDIVSSLFSAIRSIRDEFAHLEPQPQVRLIVFLRDDIYAHISDANREKYTDDRISLRWNEHRIKSLLAFRIAKAAAREPDTPFDALWKELCGDNLEFTANRKWEKFEFISSFTFLRPRDYVYYLSRCCHKAVERAEGRPHPIVISGDVLQLSAADFSRHLRREIEDEMSGEFPEIVKILDVLEKMGRRVFTRAEFERQYLAAYPELAETHPTGQVLARLFDFSVIGNKNPRGQDFFKYMANEQTTRFRQFEDAIKGKGRLVIHKGLVRNLGVD